MADGGDSTRGPGDSKREESDNKIKKHHVRGDVLQREQSAMFSSLGTSKTHFQRQFQAAKEGRESVPSVGWLQDTTEVMAKNADEKKSATEYLARQSTGGFEEALAQRWGLDLVTAGRRLLRLLRAVDAHPAPGRGLYGPGPALARAVRRYEDLWLPMIATYEEKRAQMAARIAKEKAAAAAQKKDQWLWEGIQIPADPTLEAGGGAEKYGALVPPVDVAWVWYLHRLHPEHYSRTCAARFGRPPLRPLPSASDAEEQPAAAALAFSDGRDAQSKLARAIWKALYPKEPYFLQRRHYEKDAAAAAAAGEETKDEGVAEEKGAAAAGGRPSHASSGRGGGSSGGGGVASPKRAGWDAFLPEGVLEDGSPAPLDYAAAAGAQRGFLRRLRVGERRRAGRGRWLAEGARRYQKWFTLAAGYYGGARLELEEAAPGGGGGGGGGEGGGGGTGAAPVTLGQWLVAPDDIALMWHAHLACEWHYFEKCQVFEVGTAMGGIVQVIPHHPLFCDDRDHPSFHKMVEVTEALWGRARRRNPRLGALAPAPGDRAREGYAPTPRLPRHPRRAAAAAGGCCGGGGGGGGGGCRRRGGAPHPVWGDGPRAGFHAQYQRWWIEGEYISSKHRSLSVWMFRLVTLILFFIGGVLASYFTRDCTWEMEDTGDGDYEDVEKCAKEDYWLASYLLWPACLAGLLLPGPAFAALCLPCWGAGRFQRAAAASDLPLSSTSPFWDFPQKNRVPFFIKSYRQHYGEQEVSVSKWVWAGLGAALAAAALLFFLLAFFGVFNLHYPLGRVLKVGAQEVVYFISNRVITEIKDLIM